VIGSSTYAYATPASNAAVTTTAIPFVFTIAGDVFTANAQGLAIAGTEIFRGSAAVTISGTPISLGTSDLVVGTSTVPLASVSGLGTARTGSSGLGGLTTVASATPGPKGSGTGIGGGGSSGAVAVRQGCGMGLGRVGMWVFLVGVMMLMI